MSSWYPIANIIAQALIFISSCCNPFIYYISSKNFRESIQLMSSFSLTGHHIHYTTLCPEKRAYGLLYITVTIYILFGVNHLRLRFTKILESFPHISIIYKKKLQEMYLMLCKRLYKTAKITKYEHEHVLAYTFNLCKKTAQFIQTL